MSRNIEIHIDRIVLDGYDSLNKAALSDAVREKLIEAISQQGLPNSLVNSGYHRQLHGEQIQHETRSKAPQLGGEIANGIYNSISSVK